METKWKARHPINNDITIYTGEYGQGITKIAQLCEGYPNAEANASLIVATVNTCASVNPDNPMAVAKSIKEMYEALKELLIITSTMERQHHNLCYGLDIEAHPDCQLCKLIAVERRANKVLAQAEGREK